MRQRVNYVKNCAKINSILFHLSGQNTMYLSNSLHLLVDVFFFFDNIESGKPFKITPSRSLFTPPNQCQLQQHKKLKVLYFPFSYKISIISNRNINT